MVASLALSPMVYEELKQRNLEAILLREDSIFFWKRNLSVKITPEIHEQFSCCDNYDVFQIDEKGNAFLFFNNEQDDNAFMITGKCNSNCIMCPAGNYLRKNGENADIDMLLDIVSHIPTDARHFTITGGEPFLAGDGLFVLLKSLKARFNHSDFLLLTNGRALSIQEYAGMFDRTAPVNMITGIPIHGHNCSIHDMITQSPGGFEQTMAGISNLLRAGRKVEIRIVVNKLNYEYIYDISQLIVERFSNVHSVKIMGMEMTGSAARNRDKVWISYSRAFEASKRGIDNLIRNEIDVALYNFPLCSVDKKYRMLCRKSITDYKVRFADACYMCRNKDACGGIFAGSFLLAKNDVNPE